MPNLEKMNTVAAGSIEKIDGVAYASVDKIDGVSCPSASGATRWVIAAAGGHCMHASNSDRTSWTSYDNTASTATPQRFDAGFGKDNNGNGIYMFASAGSTREIQISGSDVTSVSDWTDVNLTNDSLWQIMWGARSDGSAAGTWMAVGEQDNEQIYRSIDGGQNWSAIDLSGLTGHSGGTANDIKGIASDGQGNWMFGQGDRIYYSNNDGASFTVSVPNWSNNESPGTMQGITYTNNSWVICYSRGSQPRFRSCAASDITDWSDELSVGDSGDNWTGSIAHPDSQEKRMIMASAAGRVAAISELDDRVVYFDVNGKSMTNVSQADMSMSGDTAYDMATDGSTWLLACKDGDVWESTNAAATWNQIVDGFTQANGTAHHLMGVTCDVLLPL
ncbi:MAG: hypothetical protein Unbinned4118contig1001_32 [Prokaryotic dsDNA virus sp.]|jgi:hypothetical protein|nr:MAG: hypothetical protein Unbinned4118contig1001_32 [Prokaryotic dsDNA virus sp.]|tara:strand:+ start:494 stop:1663 length:1170 start_codon:yes stop_codon:yes gene_type:complete